MFPYSFLSLSFCLFYILCVAGLTFNAIYHIRAIARDVMFGCMILSPCFRFDFTLFVGYGILQYLQFVFLYSLGVLL